jgi:hypothetical protein
LGAWAMVPLALIAGPPTAAPAEPTGPRGTRVALSVGRLFIPDGYEPAGGDAHLVIHLHGSADVAEQNLARSGWNAVLVTVVLNGLSRVYADRFSEPAVFQTILGEVEQQLRELQVAQDPTISRLTVTSFSAGFGGVRELLKSDDIYRRIDALIMADSIHADFRGDRALREVNPEAMVDFLRFAQDAADGKKRMVISHSQIQPETYASTTETADYLLGELGAERESVDEEWAEGWRNTSRFGCRGLRIFGFTGETGPDHMKHLHHLWELMRRAD